MDRCLWIVDCRLWISDCGGCGSLLVTVREREGGAISTKRGRGRDKFHHRGGGVNGERVLDGLKRES